MLNSATSLMDFILNLLRDDEARAAFEADPEAALAEAGLEDVTVADIDAILPLLLDFSAVSYTGGDFAREYNTGGNWVSYGDHATSVGGATLDDSDVAYAEAGSEAAAEATAVSKGGHGGHGGHGHGGHGHGGYGHGAAPAATAGAASEAAAGVSVHDESSNVVKQITEIVNNYSYTTNIDDRDTIVDQSVNQNIWAEGDVEQYFDNDSVVASGDGSMAAGGSIAIDNSVDNSQDNDVVGSYNQDNDTWVDNSQDNDTWVDNSDNSDNSVNDSFNDSSDNSTNVDMDVEIEDSFQDNSYTDNSDNSTTDNSVNTDVVIEDSFQDNSYVDNSDNSVNTDVEVEIEDSFQDNSVEDNSYVDNSDNSVNTDVEVEDSFNMDDSFNTDVEIEDNYTEVEVPVEG